MNFLLASIIGCETHIVTGLLPGDPTTLAEAVDRQRRVNAVLVADGDGWVLADMLHGYAKLAVELGFNDEARSSLTEARALLVEGNGTRSLDTAHILAQIETTRERLERSAHP